MQIKFFSIQIYILSLFLFAGCSRDKGETVVLYTSVDEPFARPVLQEFTKQTGIRVLPLFDTEAAKTVGLTRRLLAEKNNPRCDVFWNNEILQTIMLKEKGLLKTYVSPETRNTPFVRGPDNFYTFQGGRLRVFLVRPEEFPQSAIPRTMNALKDLHFKGKASIALPLAGTSLTHAAVLFSRLGEEKATSFFKAVFNNKTKIVSGNATAKDLVVEGEASFCLTDTDDAIKGIKEDPDLKIIIPGQSKNGPPALLIPGSIALLKNAPNPEAAKKLIDFLLSKKVIHQLLSENAFQFPVRAGVKLPAEDNHSNTIIPESTKIMKVDWEETCRILPKAIKILSEIFLR